ncbi:MAG: RNA polymerase sigma factor [Kiritimatiellae bacterium]|nr:RNA polymerase sigma factor [Kiritimatiellia bacterium]
MNDRNAERVAALYREIAPRLVNHLVAVGQDYSAACDVVQETFLRIWKMQDQLRDDDAQVSGLAFTIAKNLVREHFRKDSRVTFLPELSDGEGGTVSPAVEQGEGLAVLRRRLQEAFATLPPLLREAYSMYQIMGLSIAEIARRTNVSESNVKVRIFRAKEKLRPLLADLL